MSVPLFYIEDKRGGAGFALMFKINEGDFIDNYSLEPHLN